MNDRIAVDFACACLQDTSSHAFGKPEMERTHYVCFHRFYWVVLICRRNRRTGKVVDLVDLDVQRYGYVVADKLKMCVGEGGG